MAGTEKLSNIEQMIRLGQNDAVLKLLNELEEEKNTEIDILQIKYFKFVVLLKIGQFKEVLTEVKTIITNYQPDKDISLLIKLQIVYIEALWRLSEYKEALRISAMTKSLAERVPLVNEKMLYLARIFYHEGVIQRQLGNMDLAKELTKKALEIQKKHAFNQELIYTYNHLGVICFYQGLLDEALENYHLGLQTCNQEENPLYYARITNNLGDVYRMKGDMNQSIELYLQSMQYFSSVNNQQDLGNIYQNIGSLYQEKGDYTNALHYFELSVESALTTGNISDIQQAYFAIIAFLTKYDEYSYLAAQYFEKMTAIGNPQNSRNINQTQRVAEALILKHSMRPRNQIKAEDLLIQVVKEEIISHEITIEAIINLCELFLNELITSNDYEVLEDLEKYVNQLQRIAQQENSYWLLAESYHFQSKLALLKLDLQQARRLLIQAQSIANHYNMEKLDKLVSLEHDYLLEQLEQWETLKESNAPMSERTKLARLSEYIKNLNRHIKPDVPEMHNETPILLIIISRDGLARYTKRFSFQDSVNDQIIAGFLTAIQNFSQEIFSQSINRLKLENYTVIIEKVDSIQLWYVFKGQTYIAQKKLDAFIKTIQLTPTWADINRNNTEICKFQQKTMDILEAHVQDFFNY